MPRRSSAALAVVPVDIRPLQARLSPPKGLSAAQAAAWRGAVDSLPPSWFSAEHVPLLTQYVRHVARADEIETAIGAFAVISTGYAHLAKLAAVESAKIAMFARAMRLTQQSRLKAETASSKGALGGIVGVDALLAGGSAR